jgi:hypothetical protein
MQLTATSGALHTMLRAAGVDLLHPTAADVPRTWDVYQQFAASPVDGILGPDQDGDGLLVQYGMNDWHDEDGRHFELTFTRQFAHLHDDGEIGLSQLHCTFLYAATPALEAIPSAHHWSFGLDLPKYFAEVSTLTGFRQLMSHPAPPTRLDVTYDEDAC